LSFFYFSAAAVTPSLFTASTAKTTDGTPTPISFSAFGSTAASPAEHKMTSSSVGFSFGSSNSSVQDQQQPQKIQTSMFGNPSKPETTTSATTVASPLFNFSSQQQQQPQMQQNVAPQSGLPSNIFGNSNVQSTANTATSIFGQKVVDGSNNTVFGGGGIVPASNNFFAPKTESMFGASSNKPPAYTAPSSQSVNLFGTPAPAPTFGVTNGPQSAPQAGSTFGFGGSSVGGGSQVPTASFSFAGPTSSAGNTAQNIFGSSTPAVTARSNTLAPSTAMTFGKPTHDSGNVAFNFTGPSSNAAPFAFKGPSESTPANLFPAYGGASAMGSTTDKPAAFNFGGSPAPVQSANMFGNVVSTPNLFANSDMNVNAGSNSFMAPNPFNMGGPAPSSAQQQQQQLRRPMRQGTRRLNK
jgi:hypothetical protein